MQQCASVARTVVVGHGHSIRTTTTTCVFNAAAAAQQAGRVRLAQSSRRRTLQFAASLLAGGLSQRWALAEEGEVVIRLNEAPDQSKYDPSDQQLRDAAQMLQEALAAKTVQAEEAAWTSLIVKYETVEAPWKADVVGRAYGNRGNARSRQGKFELALQDYTVAVDMCPWSVDPVLNRGVLYENTGRLQLAERDYRAVLAASPSDPVGWNNLGNVQLGQGRFQEALGSLDRAVSLGGADYAFAAANHALANFELGRTNAAVKELRTLLRRFPEFPEARAALVAALWADGLEVQAETEWQRVGDPRYADKAWLGSERRWPPRALASLRAFLELKSIAA